MPAWVHGPGCDLVLHREPRDCHTIPRATSLTKGIQVTHSTLWPGAGGMQWGCSAKAKGLHTSKILPVCVPDGSST